MSLIVSRRLLARGSGTSSLTPTAIKTAAYTAAVSDLAMMNVPGGATALTLPTAPADKSQVGYRAIGATAAVPLTVTAGGSDTIGLSGATSTTIALADETVELQYDAANTRWISIGNVKTQTSLDGRYPQFTLGALRTVRDLRLRLQDTRLAGGNIVPRPADVALQGTSHNPYDFLFQGVIANDGSAWPWITAQIDAIASSTTRGNAVRMMGATGWIQYGSYTLAQCLAVWDKIAAYCQQKGLLLYASLSGGWTEYGGGTSQFPDATGLANIVAVAQHLDTYGCVLALDIVQEFELSMPSGASFTTTQTQIISIMNSIRAAGVSLPLTSSNSLNNSTMWAGNFAPDVQAANFDFIDRHVYYSSGTPSHADVAKMLVVMANSNVPVIIGEAGLSQASTQANITAYYNAIGGLLKGSRVLGAFAWAIADQSATAGNEWGMYSGAPGSTLTARTYMTTPFSSWLRRSRPSACLTHNGTNNTNISLSTTTTIPTGTFQIDHGGFANTAAGKVCTIPYGLDGIYLIQLQVQLLTSGNASPFSWNAWVSDTADGTATRWVNMNEQSPINVNDTRVASAIVELGGGQDIYASIFSAAATVLVGSANANGHPKGTFVSLTRIGPL